MTTQPAYEKHTPTTDALDTLGTIIGDSEKRDAIHLAVENVAAGTRMAPGQHVVLGSDGVAFPTGVNDGVGIVDPFIAGFVEQGQRFWLVVYPRQIHSLRHVWEHPAFPPSGETDVAPAVPETRDQAEKWLREWLDRHGDNPGFDAVMEVITTGSWYPADERERDYLSGRMEDFGDLSIHFSGTDAHGEIPAEFWAHVETYLGVPVPTDERASSFTCSC